MATADLICGLADKAIDLAYLAAMALLLARPIDLWMQGSAVLEHYRWLRLAAMFLIVTAVHVVRFVSAVALLGPSSWNTASA